MNEFIEKVNSQHSIYFLSFGSSLVLVEIIVTISKEENILLFKISHLDCHSHDQECEKPLICIQSIIYQFLQWNALSLYSLISIIRMKLLFRCTNSIIQRRNKSCLESRLRGIIKFLRNFIFLSFPRKLILILLRFYSLYGRIYGIML